MPSPKPPSVYKDWLFEIPNNDWTNAGMPRGTMLCLHYENPPQDGDLVLALVNDCLLVARWFSRIAGFSWLVEPKRAIRIVKNSLVAILGVLKPMRSIIGY